MSFLDDDFVPAVFSADRKYRYLLRRRWGAGPAVGFILLNPSTADETQDDPTIRRCIGFAKNWGYGGLTLGNLFAYRATKPEDMKAQADPVGPQNDHYLETFYNEARGVVCGWGAHGSHMARGEAVRLLMRNRVTLMALRLNGDGQPAHPLYLPATLKPFLL